MRGLRGELDEGDMMGQGYGYFNGKYFTYMFYPVVISTFFSDLFYFRLVLATCLIDLF